MKRLDHSHLQQIKLNNFIVSLWIKRRENLSKSLRLWSNVLWEGYGTFCGGQQTDIDIDERGLIDCVVKLQDISFNYLLCKKRSKIFKMLRISPIRSQIGQKEYFILYHFINLYTVSWFNSSQNRLFSAI